MKFKIVRDIRGRFAAKVRGLSLRRKVYLGAMIFLAMVPVVDKVQGAISGELVARNSFFIAEAAELEYSTIDEMKADVLNKLSSCESGGRDAEAANNLITYDPDKSGDDKRIPSFGAFQFKVTTVQHYWKQMTGEELSNSEAVAVAFDGEKSRRLAEYVVFDTEKGGSYDWVVCFRVQKLDALVEFIKAHE